MAIQKNHVEIIKLLLDRNARIDLIGTQHTALQMAAISNNPAILEIFLENDKRKELINSHKNSYGNTLLHLAVLNQPNNVEFLIRKGANLLAENNRGCTPLGTALGNNNRGRVEIDAACKLISVMMVKNLEKEVLESLERVYLDPSLNDYQESGLKVIEKYFDKLKSLSVPKVEEYKTTHLYHRYELNFNDLTNEDKELCRHIEERIGNDIQTLNNDDLLRPISRQFPMKLPCRLVYTDNKQSTQVYEYLEIERCFRNEGKQICPVTRKEVKGIIPVEEKFHEKVEDTLKEYRDKFKQEKVSPASNFTDPLATTSQHRSIQ